MHGKSKLHGPACKPAIAQLVEHLTVDHCSNQMVPGSIPGGRICVGENEWCAFGRLCGVVLGYFLGGMLRQKQQRACLRRHARAQYKNLSCTCTAIS